jgi:6,7-dimethyl-8-ribityllumazine synthase
MSTAVPERPKALTAPRRFAVVASRYNAEFVDALVANTQTELAIIAPGSPVEVHRVPGSFEIPLAVQELAGRGNVDAILAFGLLWAGETIHASLIATAVTEALLNLSLRFHLPVLHEVLVVKTKQQARARCKSAKLNRGVEAARAAVRMLQALDAIHRPR